MLLFYPSRCVTNQWSTSQVWNRSEDYTCSCFTFSPLIKFNCKHQIHWHSPACAETLAISVQTIAITLPGHQGLCYIQKQRCAVLLHERTTRFEVEPKFCSPIFILQFIFVKNSIFDKPNSSWKRQKTIIISTIVNAPSDNSSFWWWLRRHNGAQTINASLLPSDPLFEILTTSIILDFFMEPPTMLLVPICRDMQLRWDKPPIPSLRNCMPGETCFDDVGRNCACVTWTQMWLSKQKMFSIQKQSLFFFLISLFVNFFPLLISI